MSLLMMICDGRRDIMMIVYFLHFIIMLWWCCLVSCACISYIWAIHAFTHPFAHLNYTNAWWMAGWPMLCCYAAAPYRKYRLWCKKTFFTVGNHNNINCLNAYDYLYEWSEWMNGWMKCFIDCGHLFIVSSACIPGLSRTTSSSRNLVAEQRNASICRWCPFENE